MSAAVVDETSGSKLLRPRPTSPMQSQLEAALLGHSSNPITNVCAAAEEDDKDFQDDEGEDDDFIDEECEGDGEQRVEKHNVGNASTSRIVTLQTLLGAGILQPGNGTMSIEYMGQRFIGDLLEDGKIRSQETDIVFASPSAWAIACKRFINPDKKSGCGWSSVKYRGRKLDVYKNIWYKKKKEEQKLLDKEDERSDTEIEIELANQGRTMASSVPVQRVVVKHNTIANRTFTHDANTLVECVPFSNLGKIQPFLVSLSTNAALLMDFHCHLTKSEVSGYLAGHWDVNGHNLQITHAFPCRNSKADRENAPQVEAEISKEIDREKLTLVGWYHSHSFFAATPTLRDVDAQLDYQIRMKGTTDNSYTPCIGIIISPYNYENASLESNIIAYWVIPPPEAKPNEYGRPMLMSYSVVQDVALWPNMKDEIKKCAEYYKKDKDCIKFTERYTTSTSYIEKLKSSLTSKFPRDENEVSFWKYIRECLGCPVDETETLLSIPNVSKTSMISNLSTPVSLSSNLMLTSDIASVLFNSGKFPSASSLLGLPDPMAHSTLAANNMFLSTNLFKMQELLKPLTTSSLGKPKSESKVPLKIPTEIKPMKHDYASDYNILNLKSKSDFNPPSKTDFSASDLSISSVKPQKHDFLASDLSVSSSKLDYSLDLSKNVSDLCEKPTKMQKTSYGPLDLGPPTSVSYAENFGNIQSDYSFSSGSNETPNTSSGNVDVDKPLNLANE